ncbi:methyl-accepting chemotaxis protein [Archangium sp.]|jgi:methyl-accepting chemotaxis protein|uniref:methyl-accepting chemotaxis protein n=1 Tax=Archangium sp. TaxID=1872627 RepID=UPI002EDB06E4
MAFGFARRRSLLVKFYVALLIAVLPLLLLQQWYVLPAIRQQLRDDRVRAMRQLVETGHGILQAYEARARAGELSPQEARRAAAVLLEGLRYSSNEYYWLNDLDTRLVMHPFLPGRIGEDMKGYQDAAGRPVFVDIVELARHQGEGAVEYLATRPREPEPIPKVSYVKLFEPWGWVLGTGVYVEDIEREVASVRRRLLVALLVGVGLAGLAGVYFSRRVLTPVRSLAEAAGQVARGDLRVTVLAPSHDEVGELGQAFNAMVSDVQRVLRGMLEVSAATAADAEHILRSTDGVSQAAQEQSRALQNMTDAVMGMTQEVAVGAHQAELTARTAEANERVAREGGEVVRGTGQKMGEIARVVERSARAVERLTEWSAEVEQAVELISDVADQTRVLAVNTAIEAVRAGEHGRGFAVVAQEVRKLAEQARAAAERIGTLMKESQSETELAAAQMREGRTRVQEGLALSARTGKALERIVTGAEEIQKRVKEMARANAAQANAGEALSLRIHALSNQAVKSATGVEQITQAVEDLEARAKQLRDMVARFQVEAPHTPSALERRRG